MSVPKTTHGETILPCGCIVRHLGQPMISQCSLHGDTEHGLWFLKCFIEYVRSVKQ